MIIKLLRLFVLLSGFVALTGVGFGYLGGLHPAGDFFTVFRILFVIVAIACFSVAARGWLRQGVLAVLGFVLAKHALFGLGGMFEAPDKSEHLNLTVYQQNLLRNKVDRTDWMAQVRKAQPDFLLVQEVSRENTFALHELSDIFPYAHICDKPDWNGNAVLSKWPLKLDEARCSHFSATVPAMLADNGFSEPLWLVSLHLPWPWPYHQQSAIEAITPDLERLGDNVILTGDFNAVGWSRALGQIADASRTRRMGPYVSTFRLEPLLGFGIGIDHVLVSDVMRGTIEQMPPLGSDHNGLFAKISVPKVSTQ